MNAILLIGLLVVASVDKNNPGLKLPLGRDTTYIIGPLDKDGYIDYEIALNAMMSKGIKPQENVNALLIQVFGPAPEGGNGFPPAYYKWLDISEPPRDGHYFISSGAYIRDHLGLTAEQLQAFYEFQSRATRYPWTPKECPPMVEWLKANEKQLALVVEAVKRPKYYNPLVSSRKPDEPSNLIGVLLPSVQKCRELAVALAARAMLLLNEGKYDDAWRDIITCHRLGRHVTYGGTLIESLVGIAICQVANNPTIAYLERADLTPAKLAERLQQLRALPPFAPLADKIDVYERIVSLDSLQNILRNGSGPNLLDDTPPVLDNVKALAAIDWVPAMQSLNTYYDRAAAVLRIPTRAERQKELSKLDSDLKAAVKILPSGSGALSLIGLVRFVNPSMIGKQIGNILLSLLAPAVQKIQHAYERITQVEQNLHVAFALAAYKKDHGRYPAKLADLTPKYLVTVPGDLFSGKELIYKPSANGYLFYSVGVNEKDDGGRFYDDDPPGDDLGVKMPLPEPKKNE